ncbi:MAG TPA: GtrA family protein [Polyangiaceae bacterium]|jgi:putative flippase GtrA|nr:GtrA family protein [Polyangiaceae bacterium]
MAESTPITLPSLVRRLSEVSVVRFGIVGVSNTTLSFVVFWAAHHLMPAFGAQCLSYVIGTIWSYYWNRRWTFQSQGRVAAEASRFFTSQIAFMLLSSSLLGLFVDRMHLPSGPTWFAVMVLITVLNFLVSRFWSFKNS